MTGSIYIIRNSINGKGYVGQTSASPEKRWIKHRDNAERGISGALYSSMRLYGIQNFTFTKLITCPLDLLDEMEIHFIRVCNTFAPEGWGYNLTRGGDHGARFRAPLTDEHKRRISLGNTGKKRAPRNAEWSERIRKARIGKKASNSQKLKISQALKGKPKPIRTAQHKANIALAKKGQNKGVPWSEARRAAYDKGKR